MNDRLQDWFQKTRKYLTELSLQKKITLVVLGSLVIAAVVVGIMVASHAPYQVLYSDLQIEETESVAKKLGELNIPYHISSDQRSISVPGGQIHSSRMQLAKEGLPGQDIVGLEKFDSSTFGMSSYIQKIQYLRAIQGELTRSIQRITPVKRARVHITMPPKRTFLEDRDPPKASVVLEMKRGKELARSEVRAIAHLVASAVEGLKPNQVTIVDQRGKFLHQPDSESGAVLTGKLFERQQSIEQGYERRIEELLTPVVGVGKVIAKVTVEMDPTRINTTEETYDADKAVVRTRMKTDDVQQGTRPNPMGVPGSRSNLPGSEAEAPLPKATTSQEKNTENTTYAIPRKVQTVSKPSGSIKRLTVSVVVDGHYKDPAAPKADNFVPRSEEELERFQQIVANAVGFDPSRRDSIIVSSLPFVTNELFVPQAESSPPSNREQLIQQLIRNGLIGLVILAFFFVVLRPYLKWSTVSDVPTETPIFPKTVAEIEAEQMTPESLTKPKEVPVLESGETFEKKESAELVRNIGELLKQHPKKGDQIVGEWLEGDKRFVGPAEEGVA